MTYKCIHISLKENARVEQKIGGPRIMTEIPLVLSVYLLNE